MFAKVHHAAFDALRKEYTQKKTDALALIKKYSDTMQVLDDVGMDAPKELQQKIEEQQRLVQMFDCGVESLNHVCISPKRLKSKSINYSKTSEEKTKINFSYLVFSTVENLKSGNVPINVTQQAALNLFKQIFMYPKDSLLHYLTIKQIQNTFPSQIIHTPGNIRMSLDRMRGEGFITKDKQGRSAIFRVSVEGYDAIMKKLPKDFKL